MLEASPKRIALVLNPLTGEELKGVKRDVSKVYSILTDPQRGMCLDNDSISVHDCKSRDSFEKILRSTLKNWKVKNQLVFYFSGHGDVRGNNQYCLKMGLDNSEWYPFKNLMNELDLAEVKRAIIILDACHSGAALEGSKNVDGNIFNHINKDDIPQGIAIIASSRKTQKSQELSDGSSGVFTDIFCRGIETSLDGKGTNDGKIYVEDIVSYINQKLETEEKYIKFPQRSLFYLNRAEKKIWIAKGRKREDSTALSSKNDVQKIVQNSITMFIQSQGNTTDDQITNLIKFVQDNVQNELGVDIDLKLDKELKPFSKDTLSITCETCGYDNNPTDAEYCEKCGAELKSMAPKNWESIGPGIKMAIKAVMGGRVKREHIETLENALGNLQLNQDDWKSIFDREGASQAFRASIYSNRNLRFLALKAMLIPQFLPIFLAWLANSKEWEIHYATSLKLQEFMSLETPKFAEDFPRLSESLKCGICQVISRLIDQPKILQQSQLLLTGSGLWSQLYKKSLSKELENVINLMGNYIAQRQNLHLLKSQYPQWRSLLDKIQKFWYPPEKYDHNYRSLARLFEKVGTLRLAAIFYQIGEGSVPKSLFHKFSGKNSELILFKKRINRRKDIGDCVKELIEEVIFFCRTYAKIVGRRCSMKPYFYILASITSALLGWNIGQLFLSDFGLFTLLAKIGIFPEIILFPCIAISLAMGSVANEIFLSNPTRPKIILRTLPAPLFIAFSIGILSGLIAGGISQILLAPGIAIRPFIVRVCSWLLVGVSVGFAEGFSWRWRSIKTGNAKYFQQRLFLSLFAASLASLIAASTFELVRQVQGTMPVTSKPYEDPFGFAILGLCLGIGFSITNFAPSYMPALRAGSGFEYSGEEYDAIDPCWTILSRYYPRIDRSVLKFIGYHYNYEYDDHDKIEEGLSIKLPRQGIIYIGSDSKAHISLPEIPLHAAEIQIKGKNAVLVPNQKVFDSIAINGTRLSFYRNITLKHNYVLTFYTNTQGDNIEVPERYRMVFYNRFFDPMA